jgi:ATP-binding cassette, subfamily B, bacterial AbcA/BmrA
MLAQFFTAFQKAMGATERIQELLCTDPEQSTGRLQQNQQNDDPDHQEPGRQSKPDFATALTLSADWEQSEDASYQVDWNQPIHFKDVSFGYGQEDEVLRSLNFTIEPGQTVAFVGPSGAGKTTIFSLLERFYETSAGSIMLGEQNIEQIPLHAWREGIGYVLQESPLMSGSIKSNITYGLTRPVTDDEVREAARLANAAAFIEQLPSGYDTEVGERGIKLSGGQRQRIAIARALMRDPKLLLLDEATSNLDSESEALVQEALQNLMHGRTTLIIAHRLSTVVDADQIIFLENGILTGQGTHAQLMDGHALYRKFVHQQMKQESNFSVYTT